MTEYFTLNWRGPVTSTAGVRIDEMPQQAPIPYASTVTGLLGAALGYRRQDAEALQSLADHTAHGVVVHDAGITVTDFQTADIKRVGGIGWWRDGTHAGVIERVSSAGRKTQQRPLGTDVDMTIVVALDTAGGLTARGCLDAVQCPVFALYLGRRSCPPSVRIAGVVIEARTLEQAIEQARLSRTGVVYLPADQATITVGDTLTMLPGQRDWRTRQHGAMSRWVIR